MALLTQCSITRSAIPDREGFNDVIVFLVVKNDPNSVDMKYDLIDLKTKKEYSRTFNYHADKPMCMLDYTPVGIKFTGKIDEYGRIKCDWDQENIRNLALVIENTDYEIDSHYESDPFDHNTAAELFNDGEYSEVWDLVYNEALRWYDQDKIYIRSEHNRRPYALQAHIISKFAYDELMSPEFMSQVFEETHYRSRHLKTLESRYEKIPEIFEILKSKETEWQGRSEVMSRMNEDHAFFLGDKDIFARRMSYFDEFVLDSSWMHHEKVAAKLKEDPTFKDYRSIHESDEFYIQNLKDKIYWEYIVSCYEYLHIKFSRTTCLNYEDYQNSYTKSLPKLMNKVFAKMNECFMEYHECFEELRTLKKSKEGRYHAIYAYDCSEDTFKEVTAEPIPESMISDDFDGTLIVYDLIDKCFFTEEDMQFIKRVNIIEI